MIPLLRRYSFVQMLAGKKTNLGLTSVPTSLPTFTTSISFHTRLYSSFRHYVRRTLFASSLAGNWYPPAGSHGCKMSSGCDGISFRRAVLADKEGVMSLDDEIGDMDYLYDMYSDFIEDSDTFPLVVVKDNKVVAFCLTSTFDGGLTVMKRACRIAKNFRACGLLSKMLEELDKHTAQHRARVMYETICFSEKQDMLSRWFHACGFKPIYRKGIIYASVYSGLPEEALFSPNHNQLNVDEKAQPLASQIPKEHSVLKVNKRAPPFAHSTQSVQEKNSPSFHDSLFDGHEYHENTPSSALSFKQHKTLKGIGEAPSFTHSCTQNVFERSLPCTQATSLNVHEMSRQDLRILFQAESTEKHLFPEGRLFNFYLSYHLMAENIPALLCEKGGAFYSMDTEPANTHENLNQNQNTTTMFQQISAESKNRDENSFTKDTSLVFETSKSHLQPSDARRVAMVTFYYTVYTQTGYLYFLDVYAAPQLSTSFDHLTRHLQRHLVNARSRFFNRKGVLALAFDFHLSKDMIASCLHKMGIHDTIPMCEHSVLYERNVRTLEQT